MDTDGRAASGRLIRTSEICALYNITDRCLRSWIATGRFPRPDANMNGRNAWFAETVDRHRAAMLAGQFARTNPFAKRPAA